MGLCVVTGFSCGMPLYVLENLIPTWLRDVDIDVRAIGWLYLVTLPYSLKLLWAPFLDYYAPPMFGRRRGWAMLAQLVLLPAIASLAWLDPQASIVGVGVVMGITAFASASQDIVLDAYRREILSDDELGLGNSVFVQAYRLSSLVPGSLGLILAEQVSWSFAQLVVASFMGVGLLTSWRMAEPPIETPAPEDKAQGDQTDTEPGSSPLYRAGSKRLAHSLLLYTFEPLRAPLQEFFRRDGASSALLILAFLLLYKLGDSMATALASPFYLDIGFTPSEIGVIVKSVSLAASIAGGLISGLVMLKTGINRALWIFGFVQWISILGFAWLARAGPDPWVLSLVVGFEYLGVGLGTTAFVAFLARSTRPPYTASQLALFTSMTAIPRTLLRSTTGELIAWLGYFDYFLLCSLLAVPGLLLLPKVAPWRSERPITGASGDQRRQQ